ncbi:MAG: acetylornithine transaminase [Methanothrix sp.]|jgi:acetylornithine/N-succinyldiaminopimelate aminotransferase|nr:acetylornithine transaminase [Methanothrix sp.]MDD4580375.1 acetylornithine transaminase [Methanothrix sp.]
MTDKTDLKERESRAIFQTYGRQDVLLVRGSKARVWDSDGKEYLDFVAGIAVNNVGHCHPAVVEAVQSQVQRLIHTSNLYYTENQVLLAEELKGLTGMDRAYFCNSGAESVEAAIKLVRRATGKSKIVAAERAFHGRTLGALCATYKSVYREPFRPLLEATFVPYNDIEALKAATTPDTGAVILEPVQGEAGVYVPDAEYLRAARQICDDRGALLIFDEVQTGFGRTGRWFGKEHSGVMPDIMTLAKAMAGGLPIGAMLAAAPAAEAFVKGDHGSTFAGGPVICAAALATIQVIRDESLVQRSEEMGAYLRNQLMKLEPQDIRGLGLIVGVDLSCDCKSLVEKALQKGVLINSTGEHTIRLIPPLVVGKDDIDKVVSVIAESL